MKSARLLIADMIESLAMGHFRRGMFGDSVLKDWNALVKSIRDNAVANDPDLAAVDRRLAREDGGPASAMSLRDYFAGQFLASVDSTTIRALAEKSDVRPAEILAGIAYNIAESLLAERTK